MSQAEEIFKGITMEMCSLPDVSEGTMTSSKDVQYKGKNPTFLWNKRMVFRLGRDFDLASEGIHRFQSLNLFKSKPLLNDWFVTDDTSSDKSPLLAQIAYQKMSGS